MSPPESGERPPVRLALAGCGQWGLNYLRALGELDGCEINLACDVRADRRGEAERRRPGITTTDRLEFVLADPKIDAVVVAVEASRHFEVATAVLKSGKHCLLEKPMTTDIADALKLRDVAARTEKVLMVGHVFRHNAAINYVRDLLAE